MTEYKDIRVEDVRVGDEIQPNGEAVYAKQGNLAHQHHNRPGTLIDSFSRRCATYWVAVLEVRPTLVRFGGEAWDSYWIPRSSIAAARRRVEKVEEKPKPSHNHAWVGNVSVSGFRCGLCGVEVATIDGVIARGVGTCNAKPIEPPKQEPTPGEWGCVNCYTNAFGLKLHVLGCKGVYRASTSSWSADTRKGQRRQGQNRAEGTIREKIGATIDNMATGYPAPEIRQLLRVSCTRSNTEKRGRSGGDRREQQGDRRAK